MKKTRVLAALLCVMMVVTIFPMMASAEVATYNSVEDILGFNVVGQTYAFTAANAQSLYGVGSAGVESANTSFDTTNGMTIASGGRWRIGSDNSSFLGATKAIYFRVKVDEGGTLPMYLHIPDTTADQDAYELNITPEAVLKGRYSNATQLATFVPGTDFVEYLAVDKEDGNGLFIYAKKADQYDGKWVAVLNCTSWNTNLSSTSGVYFSNACTVQELILYNKFEAFDSVADVVGFDVAEHKNFDFTASNAQTLYGTAGCGCDFASTTFDATSGMTIADTSGRWRIGSNGSSSLGANKAIYFRMKANPACATSLYIHVPDTTATNTVYGLNVATTGVTTIYGTAVSRNVFVPGENFVEYLAVDEEDGTGLHLYAKMDSLYDGKWVEILNVIGTYNNLSSSSEFYLTKAGSIQQLILYEKDERVYYNSIGEIVNSAYIPAKEFNFTLPKASSLYVGTGYTTAKMTFDTTNGMTPNDGYWRYVPATYYSPVEEGSVAYWRAKVTAGNKLNTYIKKPGDTTEQCWGIVMTESGLSSSYSATTDTFDTSFVPGTDWVDFLAVPSPLGIKLYASKTDRWYQVAELTKTGKVSNNAGIYFAGNGAYVQKAAVYTLGNFSTFESVLGYTGVPEQSFTSFMRYDTVKDYSPVENRFFTIRAKAGEGKIIAVYAHDYHTQKNVYAFRITPEGLLEPAYKNSANPAHVTMNAGFVPGTDWQEYLVAENQAGTGIVVYVKLENGNWYAVLEVVGHAYETPNSNTYGLFIPAVEGCELSATIYATASIVLANGEGNAVYDGDTLSTPAALRIKGNNATGKVLVVTYKGDDMAKAQIIDAASLTAEGTSVDASASGATKIKVFNWDNFSKLNRVNPAITLGV